ncbi:MAG TPA: hypothetical protein VLN08_17790 [Vicinamibacterales bacterium]|nr:hypothetical protein [Vicinamibacterales bacterium]
MTSTRSRMPLPAAALAAACLVLASPRGALAAGAPQEPGQPPAPRQANVVVERVQNGPAFGVEFKYTQMDRDDAFLLGGNLGMLFDNTLFVGGAGYWRVDDNGRGTNGYGGLVLEWHALRSPVVSLSARGLIGGGIATVGGSDDVYIARPAGGRNGSRHMIYPPPPGYYVFDEGYFVFEPQVNVTVRFARGMALVGGAGYRVIGGANGWENQIRGVTGTLAIRFGGGS